MAPIAIHSSNKDSLNAEAESFKPVGNKQIDPYHSATSASAIAAESAYAAHNYHPLPVVFSRAQGVDVWDPEGAKRVALYQQARDSNRLQETTISTSSQHTAP
jgi:ornithine--oxo-acid transaminase